MHPITELNAFVSSLMLKLSFSNDLQQRLLGFDTIRKLAYHVHMKSAEESLQQTGDDSETTSQITLILNELNSNLETLGYFVGHNLSTRVSPGILMLANEHRVLSSLQKIPCTQVVNSIKDSTSDSDILVVTSAWCHGNSLRELLLMERFSSGEILVDMLELDEGFQIDSFEKFTHLMWESLSSRAPFLSKGELARLKKLYQEKSDEYSRIRSSDEEKHLARQEAITQAQGEVLGLLNDSATLDVNTLRVRLDGIQHCYRQNTRIHVFSLQWSSRFNNEGTNAESELQRLINELGGCQLPFPPASLCKSDEDLIAEVGGGTALDAIAFGLPVQKMKEKPRGTFLRKPHLCSLMSPRVPFKVVEEFKTVDEAETFSQVMKSVGKSIAMSTKSSGYGFHGELGLDHSQLEAKQEEYQRMRTNNQAAVKEYCLVPTSCFKFDEEMMQLSDQAEQDAKTINSPHQARQYLRKYFSHIPCGVMTLGGTFTRVVEVRTRSELNLELLHSKAQEALGDRDGEVCGFSFDSSVKTGSFSDSPENDSDQSNSLMEYRMSTSVEVFGPQYVASDLMFTKLFCDRDSWRVIDKGDPKDLVPIWRIMARSPVCAVQQAAKYLRSAWLDCASELTFISDINDAYQRVLMEDCDPGGIPNQSFEAIDNAVRSVIVPKISSNSFSHKRKQAVISIGQIFVMIRQLASMTDVQPLVQQLGEGAPLHSLLINIATLADSHPQPYNTLTRVIVSHMPTEERTLLQQNDQCRSFFENEHVQSMFARSGVRRDSNLGHTDLVLCSNLTEVLRQLEIAFSCQNDSITSRKIENILKSNMYQRNLHDDEALVKQMREMLVNSFGFSNGGFVESLSRESISDLIFRFHQVLHVENNETPQTNLPPPPPPPPPSSPESDHDDPSSDDNDQEDEDDMELSQYSSVVLKLSNQSASKLLDVTRHSLDFETVVESQADVAATDSADDFFLGIADTNDGSAASQEVFLFDDLLTLLDESEIEISHYILSCLLARRYAVPLYLPQSKKTTVAALSYTKTLVSKGEFAQISEQHNFMRIAVISCKTRPSQGSSHHLLKSIFGCQSLTFYGLQAPMVLETGFGFVKNGDDDNVVFQLFHLVSGSPVQVRFVLSMVDMVIFESGGANELEMLKDYRLSQPLHSLFWKPSDSEEPKFKNLNDPLVSNVCSVTGSSNSFLFKSAVQGLVLKCNNSWKNGELFHLPRHVRRHPDVSSIQDTPFVAQDDMKFASLMVNVDDDAGMISMLEECDLRNLRENEFILQKQFHREVEAQRRSNQTFLDPASRTRSEIIARNARDSRVRHVNSLETENLPIMKLFLKVLSCSSATQRSVSKLFFELTLNKVCTSVLQSLIDERNEARSFYEACDELQNPNRKQDLKDLYENLSTKYANSVVTVEHIWREMSVMYEAMCSADFDWNVNASQLPPNRHHEYPRLAALHLLDGHSLELVDGECSKCNLPWFQAVMVNLNQLIEKSNPNLQQPSTTRAPRIFVLSILGTQSSGKSTLLNIMFGCRLRTSAERCTKGINVQLIPCEGQEFDYILLLDVEGVRSIDLAHKKNSLRHDNRLGALAVWIADATLVLFNGNDFLPVLEILSVVKTMSERTVLLNGNIFPSISYAIRSINAQGEESVRAITSSLQKRLDQLPPFMRRGFDKNLDIHVLGNITSSDIAPSDLPLPEYGKTLLRLRTRLVQRILNQNLKFKKLLEWVHHVKIVEADIRELEELMVFRCTEELEIKEELEKNLSERKRSISAFITIIFDEMQKQFNKKKDEYRAIATNQVRDRHFNGIDRISKIQEAFIELVANELIEGSRDKMDQEHESLKSFLRDSRYDDARDQQLEKWKQFIDIERSRLKQRASDLVQSQEYFLSQYERYERQITDAIDKLCEDYSVEERRGWSLNYRTRLFNDVFDTVVQRAHREQLPMHLQVESNIRRVYYDHRVSTRYLSNQSAHLDWSSEESRRFVFNIIQRLDSWWRFKPTRAETERKGERLSQMMNDVDSAVRRYLSTLTMYSEGAVHQVINITRNCLDDASEKSEVFCAAAHHVAQKAAMEMLTEKQEDWDASNSIAGKLNLSRPGLEIFFKGVLDGRDIVDTVVDALVQFFSQTIKDGFIEHLSNKLFVHVRDSEGSQAGFVTSSKVLQALADKDLLENIDNDIALRTKLSCSATHYRHIARSELRKQLHAIFFGLSFWTEFQRLMIAVVNQAAESAGSLPSEKESGTPPARARCFFTYLNNNINNRAMASLLTTPDTAARIYAGLDKIDDVDVFRDIAARITATFPSCSYEATPVPPCAYTNQSRRHDAVSAEDDIISKVFERLDNNDISEPFRQRCNKCCPLCGIQCDHPGGIYHEGKHTCSHQPGGLQGIRVLETKVIDEESCVTSAKNNRKFHRDGDHIPYREFHRIDATWEQPPFGPDVTAPRLKVREYIFDNKQELLHRLYPDTIPATQKYYNHQAADLFQELQNIIVS